jgi:membrane protease subunit HflK
VSDPSQYLFEVRDLEETFHAMNEALMCEVVGDRTVTEVLTVGRQEIIDGVTPRPAPATVPVAGGGQ